jgi:hypothetical protein
LKQRLDKANGGVALPVAVRSHEPPKNQRICLRCGAVGSLAVYGEEDVTENFERIGDTVITLYDNVVLGEGV